MKGGTEMTNSTRHKALACGVGMFALAWSCNAAAQTQPDTQTQAAAAGTVTEDAPPEAEITVTGSRLRGAAPVGSSVIALGRDAIETSGAVSTDRLIQQIPQVFDLGVSENSRGQGGGSGNIAYGNTINLRGIGPYATLILVDGHRAVNNSRAFEPSVIPTLGLERVEVVADGASAIYGSDAVAGVVNYVLRKDYDGIEASLRASNNTGAWEWAPSITAGTDWDLPGLGAGNVLVSYEYTDRDAYLRGRNKFLRDDLTPLGGVDRRISGSTAVPGWANIYVAIPNGGQNTDLPRAGGFNYYGLPQGDNVGLSVGDLRVNDPNLIDSADYVDYTGTMKRHQLVAFLNQELSPDVEVFVQGIYMDRDSFSRSFNTIVQNVTLSPNLYDADGTVTAQANPNYITGIPDVAPGAALNVQYTAFKDFGATNWDVGAETFSLTGGVRVKLPAAWEAEAYYSYGEDKACNFCQTGYNVNPTALQYQINIGAINPLSSEPLSQAQIATFIGDNVQRSGNGMQDGVLKFDGPLFDLPGGEVRAAFGGEYNSTYNYNVNGANRNADNGFILDTTAEQSRLDRTVWSAFGEVYLPLVSADMDVPLVRDLALSAAVRYDHYSDAGETTNPKIGVTWEVTDALSLRGSWGTSFRAPTLPDVNPYAFSVSAGFPVTNLDPRIENGFLNLPQFGVTLANAGWFFGSNPDLKPETATTWSLGADLDAGPFRASLTYYNINYTNRIQAPDVFTAYGTGDYPDYGGYGDYIIPINNPATCVNSDISTADPALQPFLRQTILYGGIANYCAINVVLDQRYTNLAATKQDGLDASLGWAEAVGDVYLNASISANVVLNNKEQVIETEDFVDRLGFYNTPIKWRGRGNLGANYKGFSANLFGNYTGSYVNDNAVDQLGNTIADREVGAWVTFDLTLGYDFGFSEPVFGALRNVRASVTAQNLFDRDPPIVITSQGAYNPANSNPYGRTFTLQVTTRF